MCDSDPSLVEAIYGEKGPPPADLPSLRRTNEKGTKGNKIVKMVNMEMKDGTKVKILISKSARNVATFDLNEGGLWY